MKQLITPPQGGIDAEVFWSAWGCFGLWTATVVLLLSAAALLAINQQSLVNYALVAIIMTSSLAISFVKQR